MRTVPLFVKLPKKLSVPASAWIKPAQTACVAVRLDPAAKSAPPLPMVSCLRTRSGTVAPELLSKSVLVEPAGAEMVRLLIVMTAGVLVVTESMVMVLVPALVRSRTHWPASPGSPADQSVAVSHLPLTGLIQTFGPGVAAHACGESGESTPPTTATTA